MPTAKPPRPPRWTVTDDDGNVATIEVAGGSLILVIETGNRFRTESADVAQDFRAKMGAAMGQLLADRGETWSS